LDQAFEELKEAPESEPDIIYEKIQDPDHPLGKS
jgi:hypothetical protein